MGKKVIVGVDDGIILDASRCVVIDTDDLGEADIELLSNGTELEAITVANRLGRRLDVIGEQCGWGDLHYTNCLSLSPEALRDEASALYGSTDDRMAQAILEWVAHLSDDKLSDMAYFILESDTLWDVWRVHVVEAFQHFYSTRK